MAEGREYLGRGLTFPVELVRGRGNTLVDTELLNQSIKIILSTPIGTRLFLPEFGSRIRELQFEPNDEVLHDLLGLLITQALVKWETRIKVVGVGFESIDDLVECTVRYKTLSSNEINSYVYPFYRKIKY